MKMITIPESEYKALRDKNNSLRKLLNRFMQDARELVEGEGAKQTAPAPPKKLTRNQIVEKFRKQIREGKNKP